MTHIIDDTSGEVKNDSDDDQHDKKLQKMFELDNKCHFLPTCVHSKECCRGVAKSFQPMARAIPKVCNITKWKKSKGMGVSGVDLLKVKHIRGSIRSIVKKYLNARGGVQNRLLLFEYEKQKKIGDCPSSFDVGTPTIGSQEDTKEVVSPFSIENIEAAQNR